MRYGLLLFPVLLCFGCGREGIDAADLAATTAWNEFVSRIEAQEALAEPLFRSVSALLPQEATAVEELRTALKQAAAIDLRQIDLTDREALGRADRAHRDIRRRMARLTQALKQDPQAFAAIEIATIVGQVESAEKEVVAARERYGEAAMLYNRALRTFPESITNNMFLRLTSKAMINGEQERIRRKGHTSDRNDR